MTVAPETVTFHPGDRVNWLHTPRGGYGYIVPVAGVVVKVGQKRVLIRTASRFVGGEWDMVERWVTPDKLTLRDKIVPEVDG